MAHEADLIGQLLGALQDEPQADYVPQDGSHDRFQTIDQEGGYGPVMRAVLVHHATGDTGQPVEQKVHYTDCGYTEPGPAPFVCGWCRFMIQGGEYGVCSRTHGPHPDGMVAAEGACIFFKHREEAESSGVPIAHEVTGEHMGPQEGEDGG